MRTFSRIRLPRMNGPGWGPLVAFARLPGPPLGAAVCALLVGTTLVAGIVLVLNGRQHRAASEARAADQAQSFAAHSAWLATGDAFGGYIQLLRDADDADVRRSATPSDLRTDALRRLLELNTNRFDGLAVVHLNGTVLAASDAAMMDAPASPAFAAVRANHGNANSDIIITESGALVDYASILIDDSGEKWAVLVARAVPDRLWQSTLAATIDHGKNVVINSEGQLAAGVPAGEAGQLWSGSEWTGGTIRSSPGGVDSVCALQAIARDTQIDHGWVVASCLPTATVLAGSSFDAGLVVPILSVLVIVATGAAALWAAARQFRPPVALEIREPEQAAPEPDPATEPELDDEPGPQSLPQQTIEARLVIEAYEARNARLALQVRDSVQARLLVASSRIEEALAMENDEPALARAMLEHAAHELDDVNEHELRAMGQDLYPDLVRLGLPAALRSLRKDVADVLNVEVDAGGDADSLDPESDRALSQEMRIVLYRFVLDAVSAVADAGLEACAVTLRRPHEGLWLGVKAHGQHPQVDQGRFEINRLAIEAYGGELALDVTDESVEFVAQFSGGEQRTGFAVEAASETDELEANDDANPSAAQSADSEIEAA